MRLVFDIETDGLLDTISKVHCIAVYNLDTNELLEFNNDTLTDGVNLLMSADLLIGHNIINFDIPALKKVFPFFTHNTLRDTYVMSQMMYPDIFEVDLKLRNKGKDIPRDAIGRHSLKAWGYRLGEYKGEYTAGWEFWTPEMQSYNNQDVKVTCMVWEKLSSKGFSERAIDLEHRFAYVISLQQQHGVGFNVEAAIKLYAKLLDQRVAVERKLREIFPDWEIKTPFTPKVNNQKLGYVKGVPTYKVKKIEFNPYSDKHVIKCLTEKGWKPTKLTKKGNIEVKHEVLSKLPIPEARLFAHTRLINDRITQLIEGPTSLVKCEVDGKIHGSLMTCGTPTGRCKHSRPNINLPKVTAPYGKEMRGLVEAPKGFSMLGADASGLELRCLAHYMAAYDGGAYGKVLLEGDVHTFNQKAAGLPTRENAKTFIYGWLYGAGDEKIGLIVKKGPEEGKRLKLKFLKSVPAVKKLKSRIEAKVEKHNHLIGIDGRVLKIRKKHAALNSLLQSCGSIIVKLATVLIYEKLTEQGYRWGTDWAQVLHVHDEVQLIVREGLEDEIGQIVVECFREAGRQFNLRCPIDAEYKTGRNWAETH